MKQKQRNTKQFIPHECDNSLVTRFADYISKVALPKEKITEYEKLKEAYLTACQLNKGPDLDRSIYWAQKAREANRKIRRILDVE